MINNNNNNEEEMEEQNGDEENEKQKVAITIAVVRREFENLITPAVEFFFRIV